MNSITQPETQGNTHRAEHWRRGNMPRKPAMTHEQRWQRHEAIWQLYSTSNVSIAALAEQFGLTRGWVREIVYYKHWAEKHRKGQEEKQRMKGLL